MKDQEKIQKKAVREIFKNQYDDTFSGFGGFMFLQTKTFEQLRRPRRNRKSAAIRSLVQETNLLASDLIAPFFLIEGERERQEIPSMPHVYRWTIDLLLHELERLQELGLRAVALFPFIDPHKKDPFASEALREDGLIPNAIQKIKSHFPDLCVIGDIALDPYTSHSHDGIVNEAGDVLNDPTVEILSQMALLYAQCGVDIVAPSDMMDGRVAAIRRCLDLENFQNVSILSYAAKYASCLYAPFRDAIGSKLAFGNKLSYQMNPANRREAILEASLDENEGADMLLVKPALFYLDVISEIRKASSLPLCAYHVSGEYSMVMAAHEKGFLHAENVFYEALLSIKRAGADAILSYAVPMILPITHSN